MKDENGWRVIQYSVFSVSNLAVDVVCVRGLAPGAKLQ